MKKTFLAIILTLFSTSIFAIPNNLIYRESFPNDIKRLTFSLRSENLTIKQIYGDEITIEVYSNNKKHLPTIRTSNATLTISSSNNNIHFGEYCDVEICIPEDKKFKDIKIDQTSGTTNIEKLEAEKIILRASSGSLDADYLSSDTKLIIDRTSGSTKIGTVAADEFSFNSSSGSCKIGKINTIDAVIKATSGSFKANKLDTESFDIFRSSGSTDIEHITADFFTVESTSGSVQLEFDTPPVATSKVETSSGSVKMYFLSKDGFNLEYSTSSGTFNDTIKNNRFSPRGTYKEKYFNGGADIKVSTSSGSFTLGD